MLNVCVFFLEVEEELLTERSEPGTAWAVCRHRVELCLLISTNCVMSIMHESASSMGYCGLY